MKERERGPETTLEGRYRIDEEVVSLLTFDWELEPV